MLFRSRTVRALSSRIAAWMIGRLARLGGVAPPSAAWRFVRGPTFDNSVGRLEITGRTAHVTISRTSTSDLAGAPPLQPLHVCALATPGDDVRRNRAVRQSADVPPQNGVQTVTAPGSTSTRNDFALSRPPPSSS